MPWCPPVRTTARPTLLGLVLLAACGPPDGPTVSVVPEPSALDAAPPPALAHAPTPSERSVVLGAPPPAEGPDDPITHLDSYGDFGTDGLVELLELTVHGDRVAACSGVLGLAFFDATEPSNLVALSRVGFHSLAGSYARCQHVASAGEADGRLYASSHVDDYQPQAFIAVVEAPAKGPIRERAIHVRDEQVAGLAVLGDLLLVTAHQDGLLVFERGEDGALTELARLGDLGNAWAVAARDGWAWVADGDGGLVAVSLEDPAAPVAHARLELPGTPHALAIDGGRAVVALGADGVALVSVEDPGVPELREVRDTPGSAQAVAFGGRTGAVYVADWDALRVLDASGGDRLEAVGHEPLATGDGQASRSLGVAARGDTVFSANWTALDSYRYRRGIDAPDVEVSPAAVALLPDEDGVGCEGDFTLTNEGTAPLVVLDIRTSRGLSVEGPGTALLPGEAESVRVFLNSSTTAPFAGQVRMVTNDPDQPERVVAVSAYGAGVSVGDPLPDLQFLSLEGEVLETAGLRGQVVLLDYFATF